MNNKLKVTMSLDFDSLCVLDTIANEFGLSRSELVEKFALFCGFNRYGFEGLLGAWNVSFHPKTLKRFHSFVVKPIDLYDVFEGNLINQDLPFPDKLE